MCPRPFLNGYRCRKRIKPLSTFPGSYHYVLYGVAAILLAEGLVDRVLVLCPSNTIETGLLAKFRDLAGNADLRGLLPANAKVRAPKIINASETIVDCAIRYSPSLYRANCA